MDRGVWRATTHGVTKSWTRPSDLGCMLWVLHLTAFTNTNYKNYCVFSENFIDITFTFKFITNVELFFTFKCKVGIQLLSFACGYIVVLVPFVEKTNLSLLNGLGTLVKTQWNHCICIYKDLFIGLSPLYLIPLPHSLNYCPL